MRVVEFAKIVGLCIVAAVFYGICHDMVTAHLDLEYFTEFHPPLVNSQSPVVMALAWGVLATWWMGAFLGVMLGLAAQVGEAPILSWRRLLGPVGKVLLFSAACAAAAGCIGAGFGVGIAETFEPRPSHPVEFAAVIFAHNPSYFASFFGGVGLVVWALAHRAKSRVASAGTAI